MVNAVELYQLQCFLEVAKLQNMTAAAQKLYVSQPSLSKTISRLEKEIGVMLFDRLGTTIRLNAYGEELLKTSEEVILSLDKCKAKIAAMTDGDCGTVYIGSNINPYLDDLYEGFSKLHPMIHLKICSCNTDELYLKLASGELDITLSTHLYKTHDIKSIPLFKERTGVCLSEDHPLASKDKLCFSDLKDERFVVNNSTKSRNNQTLELCARAGFAPNIILEGPLPRLCGSMLLHGNCIMILSKSRFDYCRQHYPEEFSRLIHRELCDEDSRRTTYAAVNQTRTLTTCCENFLRYVQSYCEQFNND